MVRNVFISCKNDKKGLKESDKPEGFIQPSIDTDRINDNKTQQKDSITKIDQWHMEGGLNTQEN